MARTDIVLTKADLPRKHRQAVKRRLKKELIAAYGGMCTICGEDHWEFLCLDHVNGDGNEERKDNGNLSGYLFYAKLRRRGYPKDGYQLLCYSCNMAKSPQGA